MAGQEQQQQPTESAFNQRADAAASALKGDLSRRLGIDLPPTKVQVGPDGKPPPPLPPEGSYARQELEVRREEALAALADPGRTEPPPPRQQVAEPPPPMSNGQQPEDLSSRAQARISELVASLREKDHQLQQMNVARSESEASLRQQMTDLQASYERLVRSQLDQLDPDTRLEVLHSAAIKQAVEQSQQKIMNALAPKLQRFEERELQHELYDLSQRYPGFNAEVHLPLIKQFRDRNPACSIEHAFKAVATVEELHPRQSVTAPAVPPSVPPGRGANTRYQQPQQPSDPEQEMREEAQQAYALLRSADPAERKRGTQMVHQNLMNRLSPRLPSQ